MNLDCTILHLEDDDNDSLFFQRALERLDFVGAYRRVSTVQEALDYFAGAGDFRERKLYPLPNVLVADNSLGEILGPQTSDLIQWLNGRTEFRSIVCVMLTGDMSAVDQAKWRDRGISCILFKGASHEDIEKSVAEVLRRC